MNKFAKLVGFDPEKKQTSVRTEIIAGIVTFLAMAYILTVNPAQIVGGGSPYCQLYLLLPRLVLSSVLC